MSSVESKMTDSNLPASASQEVVETFRGTLLAMDKPGLNLLKIAEYPKWARRVMNDERCRRKGQGGVTDQAAKKEKSTASISVEATPPPRGGHSSNRSRKTAASREEVDGAYLHEALAKEAGYTLVYDENLKVGKDGRYGGRSIVGKFTCTKCRPKNPRVWNSGIIATELWLSTSNRYRTLLHSQKCKACNNYAEPEVDIDNYVYKVVRAFDLWKDLREPELRNPGESIITAPHDSERCHGCEIGICRKGDRFGRPRSPTFSGLNY
ncbi:hypothetical protein BGZ58_000803 [Dissophora ornata]|nr:hypothetical protein BGZ58_000803 [Dissophora ornata]